MGLAFGAGKDPMTPFKQHDLTNSVPDTKNIGAEMTGMRSWFHQLSGIVFCKINPSSIWNILTKHL
jgi:hypothetical protein